MCLICNLKKIYNIYVINTTNSFVKYIYIYLFQLTVINRGELLKNRLRKLDESWTTVELSWEEKKLLLTQGYDLQVSYSMFILI